MEEKQSEHFCEKNWAGNYPHNAPRPVVVKESCGWCHCPFCGDSLMFKTPTEWAEEAGRRMANETIAEITEN